MILHDIAHGRSGDKGNKANVAIIARNRDDYPFIRNYLTEDHVKRVFEPVLANPSISRIDRYELPRLGALNFVLHDALDGGASEALRVDTQGKTYAAWLLREEITQAYAAFEDQP